MRDEPRPDGVPGSVNRYLLPDERQVIVVRTHPVGMIAPGLALPGVLAAAARLARRSGRPGVVWAASGLVAADCARQLAAWPISYFVITSKRVLMIRGGLSRTVTAVPLDQVESLELHRTILGRMLNYGSLAPRSGSGRRMLPRARLPYPDQLYLELSHLIQVDAASDKDPEDGL